MKKTGNNQPAARTTPRPRRRIVLLAFGATFAIALGGAAFSYRNHVSAASLAHRYTDSNQPPITLDPLAFEGEARESYKIAREHPELLARLHCYCNCDVKLGHRNLLDCYRDTHAASCGICMGEARDAEQMSKQGSSIDDIRDALKSRYENQE